MSAGIIALYLLASLMFAGCKGTTSEANTSDIAGAAVARVTRENLSSTLTVAGQFQPYQDVELHAKVSGYVRHINVDIGDRVRSGQVIATLEIPELTAQLTGAQAEVRHSQSEIARAQSEVVAAQSNHAALHSAYTRLEQAAKQRPGLIAEQELDDARAKDQDSEARINIAKSALSAAEQRLGVSRADSQRLQSLSDYSTVTAPFNGVITMRYADTGSLIQAGTASNTQAMPLVRIAQSDVLRLRMPVPESDVPYIQDGGQVTVKVQATGKTFVGRIVRFARALDPSTRTMLAEVDVANSTLALSPGMYAETVISLQQRNHVLTIPIQAIVQGESQPYVLVVDSTNHVRKKLVTLGIQGADKAEITNGLSDNELVIVSAQTNYQAGQVVRPKMASVLMPNDGDGN
ncbi:efflux RND transporter periplasmic adaptor subunit [Edaphobacter albus]|uniref:efflux RND transporter periplasmic adaptor subunit n=1 Tax=Edaphobacter sp. 4G125 TaxID=2763071 RepID=UPI00164804F7|nr:efflux RND transporter periplasmic adaptor subunit [Edaphobacter sp. 4G125]QNI35682.1 efflux RND transporter periplasmic adaptor subunit [Edaphobacter sp. 4G125]